MSFFGLFFLVLTLCLVLYTIYYAVQDWTTGDRLSSIILFFGVFLISTSFMFLYLNS